MLMFTKLSILLALTQAGLALARMAVQKQVPGGERVSSWGVGGQREGVEGQGPAA